MRKRQFVSSACVFGGTLATGVLVAAYWNYTRGNAGDDRRDVLVFFAGLGAVFGIAGAYLVWRLLARKIPFYFVTVALGLFVIVPPLIGSPSGRSPMVSLAFIAATSLVATTVFGIAWGSRRRDL